MQIFKMALETDFLLFVLGIFWFDISEFVQTHLSQCNPKVFALILAFATYAAIKNKFIPTTRK